MKRIGIYGGTFDPPHMGHVRGVQYALSALKLDAVLVIPASTSPGKTAHSTQTTARQRLEMTQLAMAHIPNVQVLDTELRRGGVSYTVDTLEELKKQYPEDELILLVGSDMLQTMTNWYRLERILELATVGVLCRTKQESLTIAEQKKKLEAMGANVYLTENAVTEISSTDIRRLIAFRCADAFLPPQVTEYIHTNGLYDIGRSLTELPEAELETVVKDLLKPNRIKHVLGCRDTAVELAKRWGANETDAARAGLLHDITKALDGPLQLTLCSAYGIVLDDFSTRYPKTLHALTGALVAHRIFGENEAVVAAIASHTTGKSNMNTLEQIIYVADYMEPNRDFPGVEELRRLAYTDLRGAMKLGLEMTLAMLQQQGSEVSPGSREALAWLSV